MTHKFKDVEQSGRDSGRENGRVYCNFEVTTYWAGQFEALRAGYLGEDENAGFIRSLATSQWWSAEGGKSKAKFSKTADDRFVVKTISSVELDMFLEFAPAYFGM